MSATEGCTRTTGAAPGGRAWLSEAPADAETRPPGDHGNQTTGLFMRIISSERTLAGSGKSDRIRRRGTAPRRKRKQAEMEMPLDKRGPILPSDMGRGEVDAVMGNSTRANQARG